MKRIHTCACAHTTKLGKGGKRHTPVSVKVLEYNYTKGIIKALSTTTQNSILFHHLGMKHQCSNIRTANED